MSEDGNYIQVNTKMTEQCTVAILPLAKGQLCSVQENVSVVHSEHSTI